VDVSHVTATRTGA